MFNQEQEGANRGNSHILNNPNYYIQQLFQLNRMKNDSENRLLRESKKLVEDYRCNRITEEGFVSATEEIQRKKDHINSLHQKRKRKNDVGLKKQMFLIKIQEAFMMIYGAEDDGYITEDYALFFAGKFSMEEFLEFSKVIDGIVSEQIKENDRYKNEPRGAITKALCKQIMVSWLSKEKDREEFEKLPVEWKVDLLLNNTNNEYNKVLNTLYTQKPTILQVAEESFAVERGMNEKFGIIDEDTALKHIKELDF